MLAYQCGNQATFLRFNYEKNASITRFSPMQCCKVTIAVDIFYGCTCGSSERCSSCFIRACLDGNDRIADDWICIIPPISVLYYFINVVINILRLCMSE